MRKPLITLLLLAMSVMLLAIPIKNGRYSGGKVVIFNLTEGQYRDLINSRHLKLTRAQQVKLKQEAGVSPSMLLIYDTRLGEDDCMDYLYNFALRFSDREFEVPTEYLLSDQRYQEIMKDAPWNRPEP